MRGVPVICLLMLVESRLPAHSLVDAAVLSMPTRPVRCGCAQGKHRAKTVMNLVEDWLSRTICPCWHVRLGEAEGYHAATAWLRQGIQYLKKQGEFADPWSRHALAGSSEQSPMPTVMVDASHIRCLRCSCTQVLRAAARRFGYHTPIKRPEDEWLGLESGSSAARLPEAECNMIPLCAPVLRCFGVFCWLAAPEAEILLPIQQWFVRHVLEFATAASGNDIALSVDGDGEHVSSQHWLLRPLQSAPAAAHLSTAM